MPNLEILSNIRAAAGFSGRAWELEGRLATALQALHGQLHPVLVAVERGEESDPARAIVCYGAALAVLEQVRMDLEGVGEHLGLLPVVIRAEGEGAGGLDEALRARCRIKQT